MFGKVNTASGIKHTITSMKLEPLEVIRGGSVTCTFTAAPSTEVNVLVYSILDQVNIQEFSMMADGNIQNFRVSTNQLEPGEYMVKIQGGRDFRTMKFNIV
jgi:5-hydroxyisourate hydrolase-like protein (transthyretin family)